MNLKRIVMVGVSLCLGLAAAGMSAGGGVGADGDDAKLIAALAKSKHTLEAGIRQAAAKAPEAAISAKFELDDKGALALSVYTAEKGLTVDAEHNVLKELIGSPESAAWTPATEVFEDVKHVARSAEQLTILALSKLSVVDIMKKAEKDQPGTLYSVIPKMRDRKAVFVVLVAAKDTSVELVYDAMTGDAVKGAKK